LERYALTEKNVLSAIHHPFIVRLYYSFQNADRLFMILDFCPGGDLGGCLQEEGSFTEERSKMYLAEILMALDELHKRDIIYRDLKPDNILLDQDGHVMLTDFGLSKQDVSEYFTGAKSFCGSVAYLAPEMLKRLGHGKAVDWYLLGVVLYEMLTGLPPYYAESKEELFKNIEQAPLQIPSNLSVEAKSLLKNVIPFKSASGPRSIQKAWCRT
jgi:serine/threonine protein kinase